MSVHSKSLLMLAAGILLAAAADDGAGKARPPAAHQSKPAVGARTLATPAQLARGRYLVEYVMNCFACHSPVNAKGDMRPLPGKKGAGDYFTDETLPFRIISPNITPDGETGAGSWSDAQLARAIREGVGHDGRRLFPVMPYMGYRVISDEDLAAVIAYVRSIPAVKNPLPKTPVPDDFRGLIPPHAPVKAPVPPPDFSSAVRRGGYLTHLADCVTCHTPVNEKGEPIRQLAFAGGSPLKGPWGSLFGANITPHASGIAHYDETKFVGMMRTGKVFGTGRVLNPVMLTSYYRGMTDADLKAIFAYLKTLKPSQHRVDNTEPPTRCRLCGQTHGFGNRN
jgi:mono/diheme cytochrome c family protein